MEQKSKHEYMQLQTPNICKRCQNHTGEKKTSLIKVVRKTECPHVK